MWCEVTQSCPTLCDPMDCSLLGSIHGILQARILEWVHISFSRGSSQPRDRTWVFRTAGRLFTVWATMEAQKCTYLNFKKILLKKKCYHLSLQWLIIFLLMEGLKYCKNYPNVTQRQKVGKCCWENGTNWLSQCRVATNLQLEKNAVSVKRSQVKHNKIVACLINFENSLGNTEFFFLSYMNT